MERAGWFNVKNDATYLWIPEAEWLTPKDILEFQFESYHKPGFVPFAFTGAGDLWCWWPAQDSSAVVLCWRDSIEGSFDAPSFVGSLYRRILDHCLHIDPGEEKEVRERLPALAKTLATYFPSQWRDTLLSLAETKVVSWRRERMTGQGLLSIDEHERLVKRDLNFPRLDETFEWMNP